MQAAADEREARAWLGFSELPYAQTRLRSSLARRLVYCCLVQMTTGSANTQWELRRRTKLSVLGGLWLLDETCSSGLPEPGSAQNIPCIMPSAFSVMATMDCRARIRPSLKGSS